MSKKINLLPMADEKHGKACCSAEKPLPAYPETAEAGWITAKLENSNGPIYQVSTSLDYRDQLGSFKTRWGFGRNSYTVPPGLYAVGTPDHSSPVLVSANYKLSFDHLRRELSGLNLWILVLDTKGVNVWCAAGKGTFGTAELVRMIEATGLTRIISHRTLILPQLAAPGVSAHIVRKKSDFRVLYGPVRAADVPAFLQAGNKADTSMRHPLFNISDRLVLTPVELPATIKPLLCLTVLLFMLNLAAILINEEPVHLMLVIQRTLRDIVPFIIAILAGIILVPALLPYIPGRALAWKGAVLGVAWAFAYTTFIASGTGWLYIAACYLTLPSISAFLGMNFTGSTTYTSLSGVDKEMGYALPAILLSAGLGLIALIASYFV